MQFTKKVGNRASNDDETNGKDKVEPCPLWYNLGGYFIRETTQEIHSVSRE